MKTAKKTFAALAAAFLCACAPEKSFEAQAENMFVITEDCSQAFMVCEPDEKSVRAYVAKFPNGALTHVFLCPTAMRLSYKSQVWESVWDEIDASIPPVIPPKSAPQYADWQVKAKKLFEQGINPYSVWVEECRKKNISPWFSLRMNDVHDITNWNATLTSNFWRKNPQLWRYPYEKKPKEWVDLAFDYSHKPVRDRIIALVDEVLRMYDIDGVELDWQRFGVHLRAGREAADAHFITEVVERTRALADKYGKMRGKKIGVGARVPQTSEYSLSVGLDAVSWAKRGLVDIIAPAPFFGSTDFRICADEWRKAIGKDAARRVVILPNCEMFAVPRFGEPVRHVPLDLPMFDAWACCMYYGGADSLCAFNQFLCGEIMKLACARGVSPKICADAPRRHPLSFRVRLKPDKVLPSLGRDELVQLSGKPAADVSVDINCGIMPSQERKIRVVAVFDSPPDASAQVRLNGAAPLSRSTEILDENGVYSFFNGRLHSFKAKRPYPPWRPLEGSAHVSFEFPYSALKAGLNNVKISQKQVAPAKVRWVEIDITP